MTWTRHRPLTTDQLGHAATIARALADELTAAHATAVQLNLGHAADPCWPSSTTGGGGGHGGSPVEETLLRLADRPGLDAQARTLLADQHHTLAAITSWLDRLRGWSPVRTIARCPTCSTPLRPDKRCPDCGTREGATRCCADCGQPEDRHGLRPWPTISWTGWTDGTERQVCVRDWMWRYRHDGRPRNGIERLQLGDGLLIDEGQAS